MEWEWFWHFLGFLWVFLNGAGLDWLLRCVTAFDAPANVDIYEFASFSDSKSTWPSQRSDDVVGESDRAFSLVVWLSVANDFASPCSFKAWNLLVLLDVTESLLNFVFFGKVSKFSLPSLVIHIVWFDMGRASSLKDVGIQVAPCL